MSCKLYVVMDEEGADGLDGARLQLLTERKTFEAVMTDAAGYMRAVPAWSGKVVVRTPHGWRRIHLEAGLPEPPALFRRIRGAYVVARPEGKAIR